MTRPKGFTLLEVVVAMGILAFLSLFTVQAIQKALSTKSRVQKDIDKNSTLRDALRVIERDLNMAFNYHDPSIEVYNQAQDVRKKLGGGQSQGQGTLGGAGSGGGGSGGFGVPPVPPTDEAEYKHKTEKIYTQFIGTQDSVSFTSLSNVRVTEDAPISSQAEIGYRIKSCRRRTTQEQASKCLWRRISNYIHEDITKEGTETVLLENVAEFKLRYIGPGKTVDWVDSWSSGEGGDDISRNKFPYAVEITIELKDPSPDAKDKTLRMTTVAAIRNPNNPKPKEETPPVDGNGPPVR